MAPEFSNAPLCTIDIAALKATRFLLPDTRQLAYRDAAGRINSHLLLECAKQVKRGAVTVGEDVRTKLDKWVRHAKWWEKEQGVSWERSPTGVWVSSAGERLEETREAALMRQRTEELEPKAASRCEGVATRIREKFKPLLEEDSAGGPGGQGDSLRQPPLMSSELAMKPHQLIGLSWLHGLHQHGTGGILADEMGLGKTVQTISLLAQLLGEGDEGPHLVVAPVATLENWMREFAMWCPALRVVKFHGDEATKAAVRSSFSRRSDEEPPHVVAFLQRKLGRVGARGKLSYLVVDEAQKLKNDKSNVHQNVSKVEACHRLLLTGTPVENNPAELLTLLSFVAPRLFTASGKGSRASLSALFSSVGKGDGVACAPKVAKEVLSALPPKTEEVAVVRMPPAQGAAYSETVARIAAQQRETLERWARRKAADRAELDAGCEEEVDGRDRGWIASAFTDLRKAAQHPLLLLRHYRPLLPRIAHALHCEGAFGDECTSEMVLSELETWSDIQVHLNCKAYSALRSLCLPSASLLGSAKAQKLASLLPPLEGHRALIFSQWTQTLDVLEELLHSLGIAYRRMDGAVSPQERQTIVDDFTADVSISCLLLSTRACGLGINLTSADTVILHDVDFNPAVDQQAMDRVHRIGQTRPVRVITLATEGTVDEKVLAIASKKVLSQHTLLGEGGAQADGARDSHAGLMGSILREAEEEVSVKAVLRELSSRLGVDLKAAGLKPLVLQILGEEAR
ncbi:hypothetical protein EMIHUDRAFT_241187 [Emiliania huxleyi CCMP1516]|uniref:Uncharacterized protein n=2 Tax=Emiliania huxleyi TaxID=2903 RepID=A0A0D3JD45_EMIH1|nr:hypothetical protein EMIHUDRAFT_241187 [Emiliania huxleyi CCMP1516]EOD21430.1 hypothetical protein EMIHUDRAFT_241187 [Emiliania huxleyi CCMP1516]|eukprot:XP_005773859.1 hypothetical protein EMIHUDRAFT_241187 [Emiliania huxleyi CCMP1516]